MLQGLSITFLTSKTSMSCLDSDHENHPDNQKYIVKNFQNMPWHKSCPSYRARERIKNALVDKLKHLCTCPNRRVLWGLLYFADVYDHI